VYYDYSFTIPANTAKSAPHTKAAKLTQGIIHRVEIVFPSGCAGLAHCVIREGLHQRWPTNPEGSFNFDSYNLAFNEFLEFTRKPYTLTLVGWNLDDTYDHTLEVRIGILPANVLMPAGPFVSSVRRITERLGL